MMGTVANDKTRDLVLSGSPGGTSALRWQSRGIRARQCLRVFRRHNLRSRTTAMRGYAAYPCQGASVLHSPQPPDRGGAVRPTDARLRRCCAEHICPIAAITST
ncbi:hypothetical protein Y032_0356g3366 [Ancylostoma ceylanicum]|uniref:Uncharacterized protein n=1 Tax=Ancylostoma ceylanicum TaxID=53326 RepID=A0A016RX00_9BILA|nr:hypothetical protein Y032_0356g3366 [Ancylostoma ceylanicum]